MEMTCKQLLYFKFLNVVFSISATCNVHVVLVFVIHVYMFGMWQYMLGMWQCTWQQAWSVSEQHNHVNMENAVTTIFTKSSPHLHCTLSLSSNGDWSFSKYGSMLVTNNLTCR